MCSLAIVCASYDETMYITGEGHIRVDAVVRVDDIQVHERQNEAVDTYNPKYNKDSVSVFNTLPQANSSITYYVTVTNKSGHVYTISDMSQTIDNGNTMCNVTSDSTLGDIVILRNGKTTLNVTCSYKNQQLPAVHTQIATITFKFELPAASMVKYDNTKSKTQCTDAQCAIDELSKLLS